jgi:hypothetical protein
MKKTLRPRSWYAALAIFALSGPFAVAQSELAPSPTAKRVPRLVETMSAAQLQHLKLWFAGNAKNWDLAAYELLLLKDSLVEAALLYPDIPMSNVVKTLEGPLQSVSDAIKAKDSRKFASSVRELTDGCNSCHRSMGRGFVVIKLPTDQQAPGNQVFAPLGKQ